MESEEYYHTRWPGLSIFDEVTKNGAICNVRSFPLGFTIGVGRAELSDRLILFGIDISS